MRSIPTMTLLLLAAVSSASAADAVKTAPSAPSGQRLVLPTQAEAKRAIVALMGMADMQDGMQVTLGTCIPAVEATHPGQAACTVLVKMGAGSSETQADFYRSGSGWIAQPSVSQDVLPFPDPAF